MKIVVLDGYTLNPGDLSWEELKALGSVTIYERTNTNEIVERAKGAEILLTNKVVIDRDIICNLPYLQYIGVMATGYNVVDIQAAKENNIIVTNIPAYSTTSVAQMVFAHILHISNRISEHSQLVKSGKWSSSKDFCFWKYQQIELAGKTMGIIGAGRIGLNTAKLALAFEMNVLINSRTPKPGIDMDVKFVSKQELIKQSDFISLHCPLTEETNKMVDASFISLMKPEAILINTGRGPLIDEQALADALNNGRIAACGLDVLSTEPPSPDSPLLSAKNCFITPHIAWATNQARLRLMGILIRNMKAFLVGEPCNVVNQ